MSITEWAKRWGVPQKALDDLFTQLVHYGTVGASNGTETDISNMIRLEASQNNSILWRNNNGAAFTVSGRPVRYGLANDSKKVNEKCKSSDLIGIKSVTITPDMVGTVIGQFMAREIKKSSWKFTGTPEELAQTGFLWIVNKMGGDGCFTNGEGSF